MRKTSTALSRRVVGVDGGDASIAALRWAARRCADDGAPLLLVHITPAETTDSAVLDDARVTVQTEHPGVDVAALSLTGRAWEELRDVAEPQDVIVIGTDKTGLVHGRARGALSIQLAIAAPCSVAIVPDTDLRFRRGVVAGVSTPETAVRVAEAAYIESREGTVPLTIVHGGCTEHCDDGLDVAERWLLERDPAVSVRRRVLSTAAADALLDAALDKELLVLGRGARTASGVPIGAVTHSVLMNATSPVLLLGPA